MNDDDIVPLLVSSDAKKAAVRLAHTLQALVDPHRLMILSLLRAYKGQLSITEVIDKLAELGVSLAQPTVSQHLHILQTAGLTYSRKENRRTYYSFDPKSETLALVVDLLKELSATPKRKRKKAR